MSDATLCRAMITGVKALEWSRDECDFIRTYNPWGLILFKRNIDHPAQVKQLIAHFRDMVGRDDAPVLIDQEGGRVQRLGPPHWPLYPAAARFERYISKSQSERIELAGVSAHLMALDLSELGINVDCLPVLDVPTPDGHNVIGDRAYSDRPDVIAAYGRSVLQGLEAGGVLGVMKHIPGHGRARADSHLELPIVTTARAELERVDFYPFKQLASLAPMAMTAHVIFTELDAERPATTSPFIVREFIRGMIGFDGLLMSDDVSMKALKGSFEERTKALFAAGVDVALHCNGDLSEAIPVASASPILADRALERATRALGRIKKPRPSFENMIKLVDARAEIDLVIAAEG
jgi:beta-N-acetylhexosaminidase